MTLEMSRTVMRVLLLISAFAATHQHAQSEPHHRTPSSYEVSVGGPTHAGTTASGSCPPSVIVGGEVGLPIDKWVSLDFVSMVFGFGTTHQTYTTQVSAGNSGLNVLGTNRPGSGMA